MKLLQKIKFTALVAFLPLSVLAQERLSLKGAIEMGLENNYNIQIAKLGSEIAQTQDSWGEAGRLPSISLSGKVGAEYEILHELKTSSAQVSVDLNWTLFNGFMVRANKDMLENGVEGAKGSEMLEVENLVHSIINSYYYVLLQQEMLGVAKTVVEISYDRLLKEKSAMEIGSSGNYEYLLAQKAYLNDKSSYMTQDKSLRDAIRNLNLLLASEPSKMWKLTETITAPKGGYSFNAMEEQMLKDNRTLNNQYINVRARDIAISQQKSALYPAIGMYGSIAAGNIGFQNSNPKTNFVQPSIGLTLSYNLFNGGRVRRSIDVAKLNREIAQKGSEQIKLTLKNELTTQYDNFEMFSELVKLDKEQLDVAKELLEITEEKYKSGVLSSFDFREIQLTYMISASSYLQSIYNLVAADCQLLKLTGGILSYQEPAE